MPYIAISEAAKAAVYRYAREEVASNLPWNKDEDEAGNVWLEEETIERVCSFSFPNESLSDTIIRLLSTFKGSN